MKRAACFSASKDLYHTVKDADGNEKRVLNKTVLSQLKNLGIKDLYIFADISKPEDFGIDPVTKKNFYTELVKDLEKEGFSVHKVITPADKAYNTMYADGKKQLGMAYEKWFVPAVKKANNVMKGLFTEGVTELGRNVSLSAEGDRGKVKEKATTVSQRTEVMFNHFVENKPEDLESMLYFDSSEENIKAIQDANKTNVDKKFGLKALKLGPTNDQAAQDRQTAFFLSQYLKIRQEEYYHSKVGKLWNKLTENLSPKHNYGYKLKAALKCSLLISGADSSENITRFTKEEYEALSDGRLKKIVQSSETLKAKIEALDPEKKIDESPDSGIKLS